MSLRDISNTANSTSTISGTANSTSLSITVTDQDANFDFATADVVTASATSTTSGTAQATTTLTETGADTGIFTGTVTLSSSPTSGSNLERTLNDEITLLYIPNQHAQGSGQQSVSVGDSAGLPRAEVTFSGLVGSSTVTLSDFTTLNSDDVCPLSVVTYPVKVTASGSANTQPMTITISYANGLLTGAYSAGGVDPALFPPSLLKMGYFENPSDAVGVFSSGVGGLTVDTTAKTVTVTKTSSIFSTTQSGHYFVGFDVGCSGGGGGGLVRPSLVVNALAGISAALGGGGSGPPGPTITLGAVALHDSASETISMPQEIRDLVLNHDPQTPLEPIADTYEDFDLPLSINGNGFALGGYENTLVTQTIKPNEPTEFNIVFYTNSEIAHTSLYFNLGPTKTIAGSDTQVLLYKDRPVEIIDPNGNIASATGTINNEGELKRVVTFSITFSEDIQWSNSDLVIRAWNDQLNSGDTIVYDAIQIAPSEEQVAFEESIPEPEVEQLKSQHIPIWIKNNANWWSQELIEDADFVAGLEYLIQNNIVTIPDSEITINEITTQKIPSWIKNTAGWWSENQITEKEFIDGLQWLISNGIIRVVET